MSRGRKRYQTGVRRFVQPDPSKVKTPEELAATGTEDGHQSAAFQWIALNTPLGADIRLAFAIPLGGLRHKATAARLKVTGVKDGVSDVFLPVSRAGFHGLWCELKRPERRNHKDGGRTPNQIQFQARMWEQGYAVATCYGWQELVTRLTDYLKSSDELSAELRSTVPKV